MNNFVLVSAMGAAVNWSYTNPESLRRRYENDELRRPELEEFIKTSKPGHFIPLGSSHLLFHVSQE